jgi:hypothetical protein
MLFHDPPWAIVPRPPRLNPGIRANPPLWLEIDAERHLETICPVNGGQSEPKHIISDVVIDFLSAAASSTLLSNDKNILQHLAIATMCNKIFAFAGWVVATRLYRFRRFGRYPPGDLASATINDIRPIY